VSAGGREILAVPLGGDLMTPGNEVALVDASTRAVTRVRVGIRPQRVAVADNLVFVCNQYSNYITILDALQGDVLRTGAGPVEIQTEYNCTDVLLAQRDPVAHDPDKLALYVANGW